MRYLTLLFIILFSNIGSYANPQPTQKSISLLTCEPSNDQIYTAWGHSALRIYNPEIGMDMVFNYGIFSFDDLGKFIYKFVKGETDYMLGVSTIQRSKREAIKKNATLYEQVLNLTEEEQTKICDALFENAKPENCYYRYNFFFDNCATRPRNIIEKSVDGEITYPETTNKLTYREIIHDLLYDMKWYTLGIDLCLGAPTDDTVKGKNIQFLPIEMQKCFAKAQKADGTPLVKETQTLYTPTEKTTTQDIGSRFPPLLICTIFLLLVIAHTIFYTYKNIDDRWFDQLLFGIAGLVGTLLAFLSFISEHPCTYPNYNLLWLNPFQLLFAISLFSKKGEKWKKNYQMLNFGLTLISIFLLIDIINFPQKFNIGFLPLMLSLAIRSLHYFKKEECHDLLIKKLRFKQQ